jgi:hypothetical protein
MSMIEHFLMESPLGTLALVNRNRVLSGLYMPDHLRGPKVNSLGSGTTSGFDVVRAHINEYFETQAGSLRLADRATRNDLPAIGVETIYPQGKK